MTKKHQQNVNGIIEGVIWKQLLIFFFPILLGSFLQQLYNTADAMIVGNFVGTAALSAVGGTTNTIINLLIGFFVGLSSGATVIISQYFGAKRLDEVNRAIHTAIAMAIAGGAALVVIGIAATPLLLRMLNTPEDVMGYAVSYLRIYFAGTIGNLLFNIGSSILRAIGDSKRPLYVLLICTVLNVALDLFFVVTLHMAAAGAALATIISQLISAFLVLWLLHRQGEAFQIHPKKIRLHADLLSHILRIGLPTGIQSVLYALSNLIIQASVNSFGTSTIAAWTVFGKIDAIFWMIMDAFGVAVATFIAQNYGAGKLSRVKKGVRVCLALGFGMTFFFSAALYFFGGYLTVLFTDDPFVMARATELMQFMVAFFFTYVCIEVLASALRATGDSLRPMLMVCFGVCGVRAVWVLLIAPYLPHVLEYTVASYPISWGLTSLLFLWYYKCRAPLRHLLKNPVDLPAQG